MPVMPVAQQPQVQQNVPVENRGVGNQKCKRVLEKIKLVAKIAFSILLSLALFWANPAIFFISFVIGVAFSKAIQKAVDKIKTFVLQHKWPVLVGCAVMAVLVLPVFVATGSVIWSAHVGSYLSQKAQQSREQRRAAAAVPAA